MKRIVDFAVIVLLLGLSALAQDTITVISIKANLRGTPTTNGIIVTTVDRDETFELIKEKSPWYLIQTPKYVGWIHGNSIRVGDDLPDLSAYEIKTPRPTTKPVTGTEADSPFQSEYVGGEETIVYVSNSADRTLTLTFGGVKYVLAKGDQKTIQVDGGNYEFLATATGVRSKSGVREFRKGYSYTWKFFIITTRR